MKKIYVLLALSALYCCLYAVQAADYYCGIGWRDHTFRASGTPTYTLLFDKPYTVSSGWYIVPSGTTMQLDDIVKFTYACDNTMSDTRVAELYAWTFDSSGQKLSLAYNGYKVSSTLDRSTVFSTPCGVSLLAESMRSHWMDVYTFSSPGDYTVMVDHLRMFQQQDPCPASSCYGCPNTYTSTIWPCEKETPGWVWVATYNIRVASNNAEYVSQSVPNPMCAGQTYPVSVTMKNSGSTKWTASGNYRLGSQNPQDNTIWGIGRVFLSSGESIAPGKTKTFTFTVTAPAKPKTYNFQWRMVQDGVEWFGATTPNVAVNVQNCVTTTTTTTTKPTTTTKKPTTTTTTTTTSTVPTASVVFRYRATDDHKVDACTIWTDVFGPWPTKYKTDNEIENGAVNEFVMDGIPPGTYKWSVSCIDDLPQDSVLKNAPNGYWVFTVVAPG